MKRGEIITIKIDDYAFGGKGIGRIATEKGNFVVFVEQAIPGQTVEAMVIKARKNHAECALKRVISRSADEMVTAFQPVSGAPYITLPLEIQHRYKIESVFQLFTRIGAVESVAARFDELIPSPESHFYRNKVEYSFSTIRYDQESMHESDDDFALGYKSRGTWWRVENLDRPGGLFDEAFENFVPKIREYLKSTGLPAWHPPQKKGFFKHLVLRKSFADDKLLIGLVTSNEGISDFDSANFADFLKSNLGNRLAGVLHASNDETSDRDKVANGNTRLLCGEPNIREQIFGLGFEISMESFFQTNPRCAEKLYERAIQYTLLEAPKAGEVVLDLFCGTGTIGQILGKKIPGIQVIGVDIVESAIEDAKGNARRNNVSNVEFVAEDAGKFLSARPELKGKIHTVVLDPPRAGIAPKSLLKVIALGARQLVYISCNPATQARDIKELEAGGYALQKFSLVDQFPHTSHIETVALFQRTQ